MPKTLAPGLLEEMVARLVAEFQPEQIYLFGSRAWGTPNDDSDVDLLVVMRESNEPAYSLEIRAWDRLSGLGVSKDILVRTRAQMERMRPVYASLEAEVLERGILLYG